MGFKPVEEWSLVQKLTAGYMGGELHEGFRKPEADEVTNLRFDSIYPPETTTILVQTPDGGFYVSIGSVAPMMKAGSAGPDTASCHVTFKPERNEQFTAAAFLLWNDWAEELFM